MQVEYVRTSNQALGNTKPGESLHWSRVMEIVPDQENIRQLVAHRLAHFQSPAGETDGLPNIYARCGDFP